MDTRVLTAHIPAPLADKVDQLASRLERSRAWIVKQALTAWVDQEEERRRLTLEGLADVDAGRVIDHQSVLAWAESLGGNSTLRRRSDAPEMDEQGPDRSGPAPRTFWRR